MDQRKQRASWSSSLVKMIAPRLREVVSKTKMEDDKENHSKSTSCLYNGIHIPERDRGQKGGRGRRRGGEIRWIKV